VVGDLLRGFELAAVATSIPDEINYLKEAVTVFVP